MKNRRGSGHSTRPKTKKAPRRPGRESVERRASVLCFTTHTLRPELEICTMPYVISGKNAGDHCPLEELDAATRALTESHPTLEIRDACVRRYHAAVEAKRNSGYRLPRQPLR